MTKRSYSRNTPVIVFAYNRSTHLAKTIESLARNELAQESDLTIYSDGPRNEADRVKVAVVRDLCKSVKGFRTVSLIERHENFGLAKSVIDGVTETVEKHGSVIVLEDDMVTSTYFLRFMNEALEFYKDDEKVISIHGYVFPVKRELPETFFLKGTDCWGWATWRRGWQLFEQDGNALLGKLTANGLLRRFDFEGSAAFSTMLRSQITGKVDSWAVRWYASALAHDKLTLYPGRTLIRNIGNDASGTNYSKTARYDSEPSPTPIHIGGIAVEEEQSAYNAYVEFYRSIQPGMIENSRRMLNSVKKRLLGI